MSAQSIGTTIIVVLIGYTIAIGIMAATVAWYQATKRPMPWLVRKFAKALEV